jgi:hypothetical protein
VRPEGLGKRTSRTTQNGSRNTSLSSTAQASCKSFLIAELRAGKHNGLSARALDEACVPTA